MQTPQRWIDNLTSELGAGRGACRVMICHVDGSTPRELGASMMVYDQYFTGTIGGGQLEHDVQQIARQAISATQDAYRFTRDYPLGPTLGQCCGGFVRVLFEVISPADHAHWQKLAASDKTYLIHPDDATKPPFAAHKTDGQCASPLQDQLTPFYLYGAGHVGRAVMEVTGGLPLDRVWVDTSEDRFPKNLPNGITKLTATDLGKVARYAPAGAIHLVMSYSHAIDLEICLAVLEENTFAQLGLIGSATKKARFTSALKKAGISDDRIAKLICPIGLAEVKGKEPFRVALSVAGQLAGWTAPTQD